MWICFDVDLIKVDKFVDIVNFFNNYFYMVYKLFCLVSVYEEFLLLN